MSHGAPKVPALLLPGHVLHDRKNGGSEFSLLFMELYDILKDIIATGGHGSDGAVENLKYRIHRLLSKEYEDKDCRRYVKRLKREGDSLFTFIMHDVEYHNNVSERALRRLSAFRKILYGNRSVAGAGGPRSS